MNLKTFVSGGHEEFYATVVVALVPLFLIVLLGVGEDHFLGMPVHIFHTASSLDSVGQTSFLDIEKFDVRVLGSHGQVFAIETE